MIFHSVERLGPPFHSVSEVGFAMPRGGGVEVVNDESKLLFFLEADCVVRISDAGETAVKKGDIHVVPRRCLQQYRLDKKGQALRVHALKITFSLPPLPGPEEAAPRRVKAGDPERDLTAFVRHHLGEVRFLPGAQNPAMQEIIRSIRMEAEQQRPGIRHRVGALCTDLTVHVARRLYDAAPVTASNASGYGSIVTQAKEFLLRNLARELTLAEIAWHVKKSEEHLARVFRKVTGQTVFDYLRTLRLESAKTLLINSDQSLTEIARRTGFSSLALFSRNFSQYIGQNASAYRQERSLEAQWPAVNAAMGRAGGRTPRSI